MKVIVIEDEPAASRHLIQMLKDLRPDIQVLAHWDTVAESIENIKNTPPADLIFTDIQLADGLSFEIFTSVEISCPLVFTTAFDEYAIKAFKLNSIDYLLKPYKKEDVLHALDKFEKASVVKSSGEGEVLKQLLGSFQKLQQFKSRFLFRLGPRFIPVETREIARFEAKNKAVYAVIFSGQEYMCDLSLDELETMLDPMDYFRISRHQLVHRNSIKDIIRYFNGTLKLEMEPAGKDAATVSRERVSTFRQWMEGETPSR
ncbi:MAG: response regulator transcription factor [Bacteroidetes bacterium]|nr:response regulator transcription factor [Bacteroidota bacterium]